MKKFALIFVFVFVYAINIDIKGLINEVRKNPEDIKNRLIISSYFIEKKEYKKALKYLNEILKKDPKNRYALKMKNKIESTLFFNSIIKNYGNIKNAVNELYKNGKYKELIKLSYTLKNLNKLSLNDEEKIKLARVLMWEGKYDDSIYLLSSLKNKKNLDYYEIMAYDFFYKSEYKKALKYFYILYQTTAKNEYVQKLLEIYIYLGEYNKAKKLILTLKRTNPKIALEYEKKLISIQNQQLNKLKEEYEKNPTFNTLRQYATALYQSKPQEAIDVVKNYLKTHPNDSKAVIFLAKLLSWYGKNTEALNYLKKINNNTEAKLLLGKILAWQGDYKKAVIYLSDVYSNGNKSQKYKAKKMLAYIYLWEGNRQKAKKLFEELYKQNPNDEDVKEELMIINGNIKPLILKYQKLIKKFPNREDYILKLANLYNMAKDYQNAIVYYERYLKIHPEKMEIYKTLGDIYLEMKNFYKGFGNWEYYANSKHTKEAYYQLALRYYWNGFNKEALEILNNLLKKYPNFQQAVILKAKILKVNPRFVNSSPAATIDQYFNKKSDQLKILGDRAYFNELYKTAIDYYKEYLFLQPNDYDVREKYAYALENAKEYAKSAGEFFLLTWYKNTPAIEYHYAYNLQKSGKINRAKKIYEKLLNEVPKPAPEFIKKFLNEWKNAWESMNFKKYSKFYSDKIKHNIYWRLRKEAIFKNAGFISVGIYDPVLIYHKGDIYKVKFFQVYASNTKKDKGYKTLTLKCKNEKCVILKEEWRPGKYTPFNPNNSLEKYIKQNLELINKKNTQKIKLVPEVLKKNATILNHKKPLLAPGLKLNLLSEKEALDFTYLKKTTLNKKKVLTKEIRKYRFKPEYKWKIEGDTDYFKDNQKTLMWTENLKISKYLLKKYYGFAFFKNYYLNQSASNKKGSLFGIGFKKEPILFDVFYDTNTKKPGWDFSYLNFLINGLTLNINRHNMVYSRKTVCSSKHMKTKIELTKYKAFNEYRDLWWSLAYEKVDDSNNVITPQFDYSFYNFFIKKESFILYLSGWYQFNSKQTDCYYSPKKTDSNIIGIKNKHTFSPFLSSLIKIERGYSFWDKSYLYNIAAYLNLKKNNLSAKIGCSLSNTTPVKNTNNYKSIECIANARILW
ncbi:tetratricopeptide repeat protein [Caminibacter sp.]